MNAERINKLKTLLEEAKKDRSRAFFFSVEEAEELIAIAERQAYICVLSDEQRKLADSCIRLESLYHNTNCNPQGFQLSVEALAKSARAILAAAAPAQPAPHPDEIAVDRFAAAMKAKMAASRAKGRGGWDDPAQCDVADLCAMLVEHIDKGDPVDIGNFAMMLFHRGVKSWELPTAMAAHRSSPGAAKPAQEPLHWTGEPARVVHQWRKVGDTAWTDACHEVAYMGGDQFEARTLYAAAQAPAPAQPGNHGAVETVVMDGHQLKEALGLINPDGDDEPDQLDDWLTFGVVQHKDDDGKVSTGLCCWNDDMGGEVYPLDGEPARDDKENCPKCKQPWHEHEFAVPAPYCPVVTQAPVADSRDAARLDWLQKRCTGASDSERYLPFRIYWGAGQDIRKKIDAAMSVSDPLNQAAKSQSSPNAADSVGGSNG